MSVADPNDVARRASQDAIDQGLANEDDAAVLAALGYKQELRRYVLGTTHHKTCRAKQGQELHDA